MRLDELTSERFAECVKSDPVVILPLGATEAHGPHLPLGTDTFQPEYIVSVIDRELNNKVIIAPTLPYGQHSTARNVPGTIDLSFDTLRSVIRDILNAFIRHGVKRIMIISGHAGTSHMTAVTEACREITESDPVEITFFSDFYIAAECDIPGTEGDGHAGMMETSRMLHIRPDTVNEKRPSGTYKRFGYRVLGDASACLPDGVSGNTENASADIGKKINEFIIKSIKEMIS